MDLQQALKARRSVREYTEQPVARAVLLRLIDAAVQAPSAMNEQPWHFSVVQERSRLEEISRRAKAHMLASASGAAASPHFHELLDNPAFDIFYHAPALIVISSVNPGPWAVEDCALAAENLMLAACDAGLGSCWIGFAQSWLATPQGAASLQLPAGHVARAPIIVGYPKAAAAPVPRKAPAIDWIGG